MNCVQTTRQRSEARLELLRESGVNVDEWLKDVDLDADDGGDTDAGLQSGRCSPSSRSNVSSEKVGQLTLQLDSRTHTHYSNYRFV